jgi:hypothetical protein
VVGCGWPHILKVTGSNPGACSTGGLLCRSPHWPTLWVVWPEEYLQSPHLMSAERAFTFCECPGLNLILQGSFCIHFCTPSWRIKLKPPHFSPNAHARSPIMAQRLRSPTRRTPTPGPPVPYTRTQTPHTHEIFVLTCCQRQQVTREFFAAHALLPTHPNTHTPHTR